MRVVVAPGVVRRGHAEEFGIEPPFEDHAARELARRAQVGGPAGVGREARHRHRCLPRHQPREPQHGAAAVDDMNGPVLVLVVEREAEIADIAENGEPGELLAGDRGVVDDRVAGFVIGGRARLRLRQALGRRGELRVVLRYDDARRVASLRADLDDELDLRLRIVRPDERPIRKAERRAAGAPNGRATPPARSRLATARWR